MRQSRRFGIYGKSREVYTWGKYTLNSATRDKTITESPSLFVDATNMTYAMANAERSSQYLSVSVAFANNDPDDTTLVATYGSRPENGSMYFPRYYYHGTDSSTLEGYIVEQYEREAGYPYTKQKHTWLGRAGGTVYSKGNFIGDVTSTDPAAYPANGRQDGYWYVRE